VAKDTAQIRTLNRALQNCGSEADLAEALGTSVEILSGWLNGQVTTPVDAYIKALDLVATGRAKRDQSKT
jgi:hypothetical protein